MKARILIVEDERIVALHLQQQLVKLGYEVPAAAASGSEALRLIASVQPDVVLMDIRIQGEMDGIETVARIPPEQRPAVIYLSAHSEDATLERAGATRAYGYLIKPFSERELHATIQTAVERRRADLAQQESERRLAELLAQRTAELEQASAERLKAERAVQQLQKTEAIGRLTGGVAHDFNNLLTVVIGSLDLIAARVQDPQVQRMVQSASRAANRGQHLTSQLLAFSRQQILHPEVTRINPLITVFQDLLRHACGDQVMLTLDLATNLHPVEIDPAQLQSAILNLVMNARDAMPDGGTLAISTANAAIAGGHDVTGIDIAPGDYVRIVVCDSGAGMAQEILPRAIEPFFTTKEVGKGSGLGLSQVYGFVRQSDGYLWIDSEPGRGTEIVLLLPRAAIAAVADSPVASHTPAVLVVEDDPDVLSVAVAMLNEGGYQVYTAVDGRDALELLRSDMPIDVLLTDILMPNGVTGVDIARKLETLRPGTPVVLTSGWSRDALEELHGLGKDQRLLPKPFRLAGLLDEIARAAHHSLSRFGPAAASFRP